jgi:ferrous iron transport protein B
MSEFAAPTGPSGTGERSSDGNILLIGNPNVGKSALFGALTGNYVNVANYPGTTVELTRGVVAVNGFRLPIIDTPGTNSFDPTSDDERVARDILLDGAAHGVIAVADAKNPERALLLGLQLAEMEIPFVLALNMMDEARARGIRLDTRSIAKALGVEVVPTVAVRGEGVDEIRRAMERPSCGRAEVAYPERIERAVQEIASLLPPGAVSARSLALMVLGGERTLLDSLRARMPANAWSALETARASCQGDFDKPLGYVVNEARVREAWRIAETIATRSAASPSARRRFSDRLEALTTHPLFGLPLLAATLYVAYLFVGVFGAGTLVGLLEEDLFGGIVNPWAIAAADRFLPWTWLRDMLVGEYGLLTMALTYALALVLPIVGTFFIAFGALEDSGYLPRLAVMVNRVFKRMGLNGKAVLPMVLGLGCDTMATLTTRILETRKERLIVILLLALGVPCSAQLTVVMTMLAAMSPAATLVWVGIVAGSIVLVGALAARVIPGRGSDFVLELPPMRVPRPGNILVKTLARIEWYLKEAVPLFLIGTLLLFLTDRFRILGAAERALEPVLTGLLGLPKETAGAFLVGFLRRDFGTAGLYHMTQEGTLDTVGALVAVVTVTLFIPCIANFFMMVKERGWKTGLAIGAFIFPFALLVGTLLNAVLRALGVTFS